MASIEFRSVKHEQTEPLQAKVTGSIPKWLSGSLCRNGPGLYEVGDTKYNHFFDGLAKVHKFDIKDGEVHYTSRFVQSNTYKKNMAANRIVVTEFGTLQYPDPCKSLFERIQSSFQLLPTASDNTNVNIYPIGDQLYVATYGSPLIHHIDRDSLSTVDHIDLEQLVAVNTATSHPHIENDGTVYNIGNIRKQASFAMIKIEPGSTETNGIKSAKILTTVPTRWKLKPAYFHSFAITDNYIVLVESPLVIDVMKILTTKITRKPLMNAFEWIPKYPSLFHIIEKSTGNRVNTSYKYMAKAFFTVHHINAYEDDGNLVVDACAFEDGNIIRDFHKENIQNEETYLKLPFGKAWRFILPLKLEGKEEGQNIVLLQNVKAQAVLNKDKTIFCTHQELSDVYFDFPRINYKKCNGKKYNFVYGVEMKNRHKVKLLKVDVDSGSAMWWCEEDCHPSEPVFVARPGAQAEDDGVILSVILHEEMNTDPFLLVLDAKNMEELARARIGVQVHRDFHGDFFSNN